MLPLFFVQKITTALRWQKYSSLTITKHHQLQNIFFTTSFRYGVSLDIDDFIRKALHQSKLGVKADGNRKLLLEHQINSKQRLLGRINQPTNLPDHLRILYLDRWTACAEHSSMAKTGTHNKLSHDSKGRGEVSNVAVNCGG